MDIYGSTYSRPRITIMLICGWRRNIFVGVLTLLLAGCIFEPTLPNSTLPDYYGTDFDRVWNATVGTLDELGFVILHMRKEDGYISTDTRELNDRRDRVSIRISRVDELFKVEISSLRDIQLHYDDTGRSEWIKGPQNLYLHEQIKVRMGKRLAPYKVDISQGLP